MPLESQPSTSALNTSGLLVSTVATKKGAQTRASGVTEAETTALSLAAWCVYDSEFASFLDILHETGARPRELLEATLVSSECPHDEALIALPPTKTRGSVALKLSGD